MFIIEKDPNSVASESYKTLRTNIQYSSFDKEYKTIVVTSSVPGEGKTNTVGNLALAFSQGEKKVLLIDCDLRKPALHKRFKVSNSMGLSDVLIGKETLDNVVYRRNGNLDILTSGKIPPNPSEMLGSKAMSEFLKEASIYYDTIILDAPPVLAVSDAQILSTKVDGTIVVVKAEKTRKEEVQNSINQLRKVNATIIGTVLNGVDNSRNKHYYYYGHK